MKAGAIWHRYRTVQEHRVKHARLDMYKVTRLSQKCLSCGLPRGISAIMDRLLQAPETACGFYASECEEMYS